LISPARAPMTSPATMNPIIVDSPYPTVTLEVIDCGYSS
jgi:hypothetical protein